MYTLSFIEFFFFFFNDTATTEIYTLSLHDALPISRPTSRFSASSSMWSCSRFYGSATRSEEHTSELQSPCNIVCRLLLEKKKNKNNLRQPSRWEREHRRLKSHSKPIDFATFSDTP